MVYYCLKIASRMGVPPAKMDELELAAMMHDAGKITIQPGILGKPANADAGRMAGNQKASGNGYRIARSAPELAGIADYILSHHERYDGKGYPQGLATEEIPLLSRIIAVVDAFDVMTHPRPYNKVMSQKGSRN